MAILLTTTKQKLSKYDEAILMVLPNSDTIDDPNWVDPEDGSLPDQIPKYTGSQWLDECTRRYWLRIINVGKKQLYAKTYISETITIE